MRIIKSVLFILLYLGFSVCSHAQKWRSDFNYSNPKIKVNSNESLMLSNTVIIKLKETSSEIFDLTNQELSKKLYPLDISNIQHLFRSSDNDHDLRKNFSVNLSNIYVLEYIPSTMNIEGVISFLKSFPYFEYVEPYYVPKALSPIYPNDSYAIAGQWQYKHLERVKAFEAWEIEQGKPSVIIGIVDTGFDITHEDLVNQYVPGWDVAENDATVNHPTDYHGTQVAGISSAEANNNKGIAGSGYNCKFMPIKASPDAGNSLAAGYVGIQYAVEHGCQIVNLSWGSIGGYSNALQDIINYAAIDYDAVIIAAAGNSDVEADFYPAAYDHVLSVCALDTIPSSQTGETIDIRTTFRNISPGFAGTYSHSVDIGAMGTGMVVLDNGNTYGGNSGSSFSAPFVSGAAAILRSKYNTMTSLQIMELLRVTADTFYHYIENAPYREKLGKGRLNMYRALTDNVSPAVRMLNYKAVSNNGKYLLTNDIVDLSFDLWNYLRDAKNLTVTVSTTSSHIQFIQNSVNVGTLDSMTGKSTLATPFQFKILPNSTSDEDIEFRIGFTDPITNYTDYQYFKITINPSMIDINTTQVLTSITKNGRTAFNEQDQGSGFMYKNNNLLYESGLMLGRKGNKVSNCVRGSSGGNVDKHFKNIQPSYYTHSTYKSTEINTKYNDSLSLNILGLEVEQRTYTFDVAGLDHAIIVEYQIKNNSTITYDSLYAGLFCDWDIDNYTANRTEYDYFNKLSYAYGLAAGDPYVGVALLTNDDPTFYALDNSFVPDANNINPNDGFTQAEKYKTLSSGIGRAQGGMLSGGNDISNVTGTLIKNCTPGSVKTVAFAYLAADNLGALKIAAQNVKQKFVAMKTSKTPVGDTYYLCDGQSIDQTFIPTNGVTFNFYDALADVNKLTTAASYTRTNITSADTVYVTGNDSLYESPRIPMYVNTSLTTKANMGISSNLLTLPNATLYAFNNSTNATSTSWDFGDGSAIETNIDNPAHTYSNVGDYIVSLTTSDNKGCSSTTTATIKVALGTSIYSYPNPANNLLQINSEMTEIGDLVIYDVLGNLIYEQKATLLNNVQLQTANWAEGVYNLVFTTSKAEYRNKIFIRH